jgi:WD40 repeat protein
LEGLIGRVSTNKALFILLASFNLVGKAQIGWRMEGYNGQRTSQSKAAGPATLPQFQQLLANAPGTLRRIGPDGSLILYDGASLLSSLTNTGTLRWSVGVSPSGDIDIAIGPDGTIYGASAGVVQAWNKNTGAAIWPSPVPINSGNEHSSLALDSTGNLYINTGGSTAGIPQRLTSIAPNGKVAPVVKTTFCPQ